MKILFVAPSLPINNSSGGSIRSYHLYQELRSFADVDVLSANGAGISFPLLKKFKKEHSYIGHIEIPWKSSFLELRIKPHKDINGILRSKNYDFIFVRYYNTAYWLGLLGLENLILDCDDCNMELEKQQMLAMEAGSKSSLIKKLTLSFRNKNYLSNLSFAKKVIFAKRSTELEWKSNFTIIPNKITYVESSMLTKTSVDTINVLFVGVLNYAPNYDGLNHFLLEIWPLIRMENQNIKINIVGNGLDKDLQRKWSTIEGVQYHGYVENIDDVYRNIDFAIAPVYQGSGTHVKVMESLMRHKTMVISQLAHRGYEDTLINGESLFVAKTNSEFSNMVLLLAKNIDLRTTMAEKGREKVLTHHTFKPGSTQLRQILMERKESPTLIGSEVSADSW